MISLIDQLLDSWLNIVRDGPDQLLNSWLYIVRGGVKNVPTEDRAATLSRPFPSAFREIFFWLYFRYPGFYHL